VEGVGREGVGEGRGGGGGGGGGGGADGGGCVGWVVGGRGGGRWPDITEFLLALRGGARGQLPGVGWGGETLTV